MAPPTPSRPSGPLHDCIRTGAGSMESSAQRSTRAYWACQFGGWGLYSVTPFSAAVSFAKLPWVRAAMELLVLNGIGLVLTHLLRAYILRHDWRSLGLRRLLP